MDKKSNNKLIKTSEELISMIMGLIIVVVIAFLIVNLIERTKGDINIPGLLNINKTDKETEEQVELSDNDVYEVKTGDSLWGIALKEYGDGFMWTKIAEENNLKTPDILLEGQKIKLPKSEVEKIEKEEMVVDSGDYTVARGDSLWKISVEVYGDGYAWTKVWKANRDQIANPNLIEIGMVLKMPKLN
jgi:nucleoid-associated protein YgaU